MKRYNPLYLLFFAFCGLVAFTACNDSDNGDDIVDDSAEFAVMVKTFSLNADDSILSNLDQVYFSIDLNTATVFNADSLPLGTRVDSLGVSMTFSSVSVADITMPGSDGKDTVVNYLENASQAIDFSRGYVSLHLVSANEKVERDYRIFVNVHKMKPDSLAWGNASWSAFPTTISDPSALHAVDFAGKAVCFATDGSSSTVAVSSNPANNDWQVSQVTLPAGFVVNSVIATSDALYARDDNDNLLKSTDCGLTWTSVNAKMSHLYGGYGTTVLGVLRQSDATYSYVSYPEGISGTVLSSAPVEATSAAVTYVSEWSVEPMLMVFGGKNAAGQPVGAVWAFDGSGWAAISSSGLPAVAGPVLVPYFSFKSGDNWVVTRQTALLAFGGTQADGTLSRTVYISYDRGANWTNAGELMQLPVGIPTLSGASALVFENTISSRAASAWRSIELPVMSQWLSVKNVSKGVKPIESWECPYIYLFGGTADSGEINTRVWRGVINRLMFKPLQ